MFLIASAVTKAFHSDGIHARYIRVGEPEPPTGVTVHLSGDEKQLAAQSLMDARTRLKEEHKPFEAEEQLLRRMTGGITEFIKTVGERPRNMDAADRATLAILDGDAKEFSEALPGVPPAAQGDLLLHAASCPGAIGREMTARLLETAKNINYEQYLRACRNAIDSGDADKTLMMAQKAEACAEAPAKALYGDLIQHAFSYSEKYGRDKNLALALAERGTPEQIKNADPRLLQLAIMRDDRRLANALLDKGISVKHEPAMLFYAAAQNKDVYLAERLMKAGADVNSIGHAALRACMNANDPIAGMFLLKCGADFEDFYDAAMKDGIDGRRLSVDESAFIHALKGFYDNHINAPDAAANMGQDDEDEWEA
jgi:hypothetical protein